MMAAALAHGTTRLGNCAREPEVVDLADLLKKMGASIEGAGGAEIVIEGRDVLRGASHRVIADRVEAATYLLAAALAGDRVEVVGCRSEHQAAVLEWLRSVGVRFEAAPDAIRVVKSSELVAQDLRTEAYPGFPTDMQAQSMALMTEARGSSVISETIFERRFMHAGELLRMGADIRIDGGTVIDRVYHLDRGYEPMEVKLQALGAAVERIR